MKINAIQYLRAIAAVLVVYCHAIDTQKLLGVSQQQHFYYLQNFGAIGVDIFFIISGFIICYVSFNSKGKEDGLLFLKKRFFRINPSYYLVSLLFVLLNYCTIPSYVFPVKEAIKTITILPVFESGKVFVYPIVMVGWTLAFEWLFYLVYAMLIWLKTEKRAIALISIMSGLTLLSFLPNKNIQLTFISNPILWEFCFGVMIALLYKHYNMRVRWALLLLFAGLLSYLLLIFIGYSGASEATYLLAGEYAWLRVLIWGLPSASIVIGLLYLERSGKVTFNNRLMLFLGEASFAIYLVHPRSLQWLSDVVKKFPLMLNYLSMDFLIIFFVIGSTIVGVIYFVSIEKRLNKFFTKFLIRKESPEQ